MKTRHKQGDVGVDLRKTVGVDVVCDACYLPFRSNIFDRCVSYRTVEHVDDTASFFKEQVRVLKINGVLLCETDLACYWRFQIDTTIFSQFYPTHFKDKVYNASMTHHKIFYAEGVARLFKAYGLRGIKIKYCRSTKKLDKVLSFLLKPLWKNFCTQFIVEAKKQ